jgi:uncharacterized SAM-binding protein YcdF (DUF218 family)
MWNRTGTNGEPSPEDLHHAQALWDFHHVSDTPAGSDFMLVLGSHDGRVAEHAARLFLAGTAPLLIMSGSHGKITTGRWPITEAERFARIAEGCGVPRRAIMVEASSTNTGENIVNARQALHDRGLAATSGILVTKPYSRRPLAAARKQWPDIRWLVSTPNIAFRDYANDEVTLRQTIELMVGDLQRLKVYAERGFQLPQHVPEDVWLSYEFLRRAGYDRFVLRDGA